MEESKTEVLVGAAVLVAAAAFVAFALQSSGLAQSDGTYPLKASFRSAEGITVGTDVRLAGVKIGTVTALALNPQSFFADTEITVRDGILLPDDSAILVSSEGLLGGSFIEIQPGGSATNFEPGQEIEDTQGAVSVVSLMMKFAGGGSDTADTAAPDSTE